MKTRVVCLMLVGTMLIAQSPVVFAQGQGSTREWSRVQAIAVDERLI
ncbi:MAG: hypothetical protein ACREBG_29300 [Pyrinomonadaceae bacterium]